MNKVFGEWKTSIIRLLHIHRSSRWWLLSWPFLLFAGYPITFTSSFLGYSKKSTSGHIFKKFISEPTGWPCRTPCTTQLSTAGWTQGITSLCCCKRNKQSNTFLLVWSIPYLSIQFLPRLYSEVTFWKDFSSLQILAIHSLVLKLS